MRLRVDGGSSTYGYLAVLDGVAGDPGDPGRTQIRLDRDDGLLLAAEAGWEEASAGKVAVGAWHYTGRFDGFAAGREGASPGAYVLGQYDFGPGSEPAYSAFARVGTADGAVHAIDRYVGVGLVRRGVGAARPADVLGFAASAARLGRPFRDAEGGLEAWEVALELTWQLQFGEHLALQPDVQYVANPGGDPALEDAWLLGLRVLVGF